MKTKATLIITALLLCAAAFLALSLSRPHPVQPPAAADTDFDANNFNAMQADTLVRLLQLAYGPAIQVQKTAEKVSLQWQPADGNTAAFYNNNEALKDVSGQGFSLEREENVLRAAFRVKEGVVNVPNDVVLGMMKRVVAQ